MSMRPDDYRKKWDKKEYEVNLLQFFDKCLNFIYMEFLLFLAQGTWSNTENREDHRCEGSAERAAEDPRVQGRSWE